MQTYIIFIFSIIFVLGAIYFAFIWAKKSNKLSPEKVKDFSKKLKLISGYISSKEKIIDSDKLYHKILQEVGYHGDFGTILKEKPMIISDLDKIWELHKVRNKLVHDFDQFDERFLLTKSKEFILELENLINRLQ